MKKIRLPDPLRCLRCAFVWTPRQTEITMCPRCKSKLWHTKKTDRRGLRPAKKGRS